METSGSITPVVKGYVFHQSFYGYVQFGISDDRHGGRLSFVKESKDATTFSTISDALDRLQRYVRNTGGCWCSSLTIMAVTEEQVTTVTQSTRELV